MNFPAKGHSKVVEQERRRRLHLIDWPELDRALALLGFCLAYILIAGGALLFLPGSSLAPHLDLEIVELSFTLNSIVGGFWLVLLAAGLHARSRALPYRYIIWLLAISFSLFFSVVIYIIGLYTTPLWLLLASGLMMALLLLDRVIVHTGALVSAFSLALFTAGENIGVLPHAPLFESPPYGPNGALDPSWAIAMTFACWSLLLIIWVIGDSLVTRWRQREASLALLSSTDPLTGLANRRHFMEALRQESRRAERTGRPLSLLMIDADDFKAVNDSYGHSTGDEVLVGLAAVLKDVVREDADMVGRLGGEEFGALLPEADLGVATSVAERIRKAAEARLFDAEGERFSITVSVGVSSNAEAGNDPTSLLHVADVMLYQAKKSGRNRVVFRAER